MSHIDSTSTDKDSIYQLLTRLDAFNFLHLTPFDDLKLLAHFINNASHSTHTIAHLALEKMARKFKEDKGL
jgi:hypothetical protein